MVDLHVRNSVKKPALFHAFAAVSGSSSAEVGWMTANAYWKHGECFCSCERSHPWMDVFAISLVVDREQ